VREVPRYLAMFARVIPLVSTQYPVPGEVKSELSRLKPERVIVVGGPNTISPGAQRSTNPDLRGKTDKSERLENRMRQNAEGLV